MKIIEDLFSLKGKVAVVTGGAGILGSTIACGLGKAGAEIAICDIADTEKIVASLKKEGIKSRGYFMDVTDKESVKACHDRIIKDFGKVDVLVNCVGVSLKEATTSKEVSFFDLPVSALEKMIKINFLGGVIFPCQIFGKTMAQSEKGGSIINISSMSSFRPLTRVPAYSATKAAVNNFTMWLAVYLAKEFGKKLRVNAIAPGFFLTPLNRHLLLDEKGCLTERGKAVINHTPMGEFGKPEDLVGVCVWLASDASRFVTGTVVPVDGGFLAFSGV